MIQKHDLSLQFWEYFYELWGLYDNFVASLDTQVP